MKKFLLAVLLLVIVTKSEAGFRCTLGGDKGCSAGCVVLGQTSGTCDDDGECWCSEKSIDFNALLPSRCHLGRSFCEGTKKSKFQMLPSDTGQLISEGNFGFFNLTKTNQFFEGFLP